MAISTQKVQIEGSASIIQQALNNRFNNVSNFVFTFDSTEVIPGSIVIPAKTDRVIETVNMCQLVCNDYRFMVKLGSPSATPIITTQLWTYYGDLQTFYIYNHNAVDIQLSVFRAKVST
jgi:hypothetical protein